MAEGNALSWRLRSKTQWPPQAPLPAPLLLDDEATTDSKRQAYLITFPFPRQARAASGHALVASSSLPKATLLSKVLDAFAHPDFTNPWQEHAPIGVLRLGVWREMHAPDGSGAREEHDHVPSLAAAGYRYLPVKRALLRRHGLASHWSCTHTGYWSCVRYCAVASPTKPYACLDHRPELWDASGVHPPVQDCCYEPVTSKALCAKRAKVVQAAAEAGEGEPKVTDLDVWALVVRTGCRNTVDDRNAHLQLAAYAKQHCGADMVHYLWKRRHLLPSMIDDIWQWENVEAASAAAQRSRLEGLAAAATGVCVCRGDWPSFVVNNFLLNGIPLGELCYDVHQALTKGGRR